MIKPDHPFLVFLTFGTKIRAGCLAANEGTGYWRGWKPTENAAFFFPRKFTNFAQNIHPAQFFPIHNRAAPAE